MKKILIMLIFLFCLQSSFGCVMMIEGNHIYLDKENININFVESKVSNKYFSDNNSIVINTTTFIQKNKIKIYSDYKELKKYNEPKTVVHEASKEALLFLQKNNYTYLNKEDVESLEALIDESSYSIILAKLPENKFFFISSKKIWTKVNTVGCYNWDEVEDKIYAPVILNGTSYSYFYPISVLLLIILVPLSMYINKKKLKKRNK